MFRKRKRELPPPRPVKKEVKEETGLVTDIRRLAAEETLEGNDSMALALGQLASLPEPPPPPKRRRTQPGSNVHVSLLR